MSELRKPFAVRMTSWAVAGLVALSLGGCAWLGGSDKPKPAELGPIVPAFGVEQAWRASVGGKVSTPLRPHVVEDWLTVASTDGHVVRWDARTGREAWRVALGQGLTAGVGGNASHAAVITRDNELVLLNAQGAQWRQKLDAEAFTPPLVAGGRVFVLQANRTIVAFDAENGRRLWRQQPMSEPLSLRQAGVLMPMGNTLVVGIAGRIVGLSPDNGALQWESPIASARGTNDIERLVDLVAPVAREGTVLCARAFQAGVGCFDTRRNRLVWTQRSRGGDGVATDGERVYGVDSTGVLQTWGFGNGEPQWRMDRLQYRRLTAPLVLGRSVVVADDSGLVHLFSREDGSPLNRLTTDSSGVSLPPVTVANALVVVSNAGQVYAFRPQ